MRRMMLISMMILAVACTAFAQDPATQIIGKWVADGQTLEFYGQSIGRNVTDTNYPAGGGTSFKYTFPSSDQIVLDKGAGDTTQYTITVTQSTLTLTDTNNVTTTYNSETWSLSPCTINLRQLDGAMTLYALDHDGMPPMSIMDLLPTYLAELPTCPDGGTYFIASPPQCSIPGHTLGE